MKVILFGMLLCAVGCFGNITDYSEIYGLFIETDSFEEQEKVEEHLSALEKKCGFQCVTHHPDTRPGKLDQLKGALLFSIVPPKQSEGRKASDHLVREFVWPLDPTIGSAFKSRGSVFMRTGEVFFDFDTEVGGKRDLPRVLEIVERNLEKTVKSSHRYKKPLVVLFFNKVEDEGSARCALPPR